ncbi:MAG TPA: DUF2971 domain-containing protein [Gemmataceae bacterium]|nr:DUF2971 domain-containing protein [Gemmataceae bacterium]
MIVYKYVVADRVDVLEHRRIRFTQPSALNDPFESLPCLSLYRAHLHGRLSKTTEGEALKIHPDFHDMIDASIGDLETTARDVMSKLFVFLSLSRKRDNLLMWSHYADSHRGLVIGFDSDGPIFQPGALAVHGLRDVEYSKKRWILPPDGLESISQSEIERAHLRFFFAKSDDWAYEEELRLVTRVSGASITIPVTNGWPICLFDFPKEMVREVILGYRMSEAQKQRVADVVRDYPTATLYQASLDPDEFGLVIGKFLP